MSGAGLEPATFWVPDGESRGGVPFLLDTPLIVGYHLYYPYLASLTPTPCVISRCSHWSPPVAMATPTSTRVAFMGADHRFSVVSIKGNEVPLCCEAVGDLGLQQVCRRSYAGVFICGEDFGQMRVAVSTKFSRMSRVRVPFPAPGVRWPRAALVVHLLPKQRVAGSSPVSRSRTHIH